MTILDVLKRIINLLRGNRDPKGTGALLKKMAAFKQQLEEIQLGVQKCQHKLLQINDLFEKAKNDLSDLVKEHGPTHPKTLFATANVQKLDDQLLSMRRHWQTLEDREKVVRRMIDAIEIKINRDLPVDEEEIRRLTDEAAIVLNEHEQLMETLDDSACLIDTLAQQQDVRFDRVRQGVLATYADVESPAPVESGRESPASETSEHEREREIE